MLNVIEYIFVSNPFFIYSVVLINLVPIRYNHTFLCRVHKKLSAYSLSKN